MRWNLNGLWSLVNPSLMNTWVKSLLEIYERGGWLPKGPTAGEYTAIMTSSPAVSLIAAAYQQGIRDYDTELAYEAISKIMKEQGRVHKSGGYVGNRWLKQYMDYGYVPYEAGPASATMELAFQDWCLAQMARTLGKVEDAQRFSLRAQNYRNLYDVESGFMRPRTMGGGWLEDFDPMSPEGWVEGNGWQYLWHVPHDVAGLIELMGGREVFCQRLDAVMERAAALDFVAPHGKHHTNVLDYGNQPSTYIAHLFNYAGAPWLTQKWVRRIMGQAKSGVTPFGGYGGDEDQGQMGALGVLMAIGLFSVDGGASAVPVYEITSPIFDRITIRLDPEYYPGKKFVITCRNNSPENKYIQSARLNGKSHNKFWFTHDELVKGGKLELEMGPAPNKLWGIDKQGSGN